MPSEEKESKKAMLAHDFKRTPYTAPIQGDVLPKGILKEPKRKKIVPPKEHPLNGPIYAADAYMPAYWNEMFIPSEYNTDETSTR